MYRKFLLSSLASVACLASTAVYAGDYNSGVVTKTPGGGYTDVEFGSGWYLRGDITFNLSGNQEISAVAGNVFGGPVEADYEDVIGYRVGAGYQFNPHIRGEFTVEQTLNSSFDGTFGINVSGLQEVNDPILGPTQVATNSIYGEETVDAEYNTTNFMVSGFYDFSKIGRFTPYVGAGIGLTRVGYSEFRSASCIPDSTQTCGGAFGGAPQGQAVNDVVLVNLDEDFYEFAYQFSVGTAYDISDTLKFDVGYTYHSTGGGSEIEYSDGFAVDIDGFANHKVNVGLRYELW